MNQTAAAIDPGHQPPTDHTERYARCIEASKRIRWDIDEDVIRGRAFNFGQKFLPDGLSLVHELGFLNAGEQRLLSQVQGRTYANLLALFERFINAKILEVSRDHCFGDQVALEALVRFSDEELKHQALFRRVEAMIAEDMPSGYALVADANKMARLVLGKSTWSVLALTCMIELFTQAHYQESIQPDFDLSALFRDIFLFHWREESQHAVLDELEWRREDEKLTSGVREAAVDDLLDLIRAMDAMVLAQSRADVDYFIDIAQRAFTDAEFRTLRETVLKAYRRQFILSGVEEPRFVRLLGELTTQGQMVRISAAIAGLK